MVGLITCGLDSVSLELVPGERRIALIVKSVVPTRT